MTVAATRVAHAVTAEEVRLPTPASVIAQARHENFPVASRVLPRRSRRHLLAVYGFARLVDDIGDELEGDRLEALDWAEAELDAAFTGTAAHPVFTELQAMLAEIALPRAPFADLIEANRQDQIVSRYASYEDLLDYCRLSANPVGRLVLYVLGESDHDRAVLSDKVCTGLQLVEHWQDVREDFDRSDRIYIPTEDLDRFGVAESDLGTATAGPAFRRLMAFEVGRARDLLLAGSQLVDRLRGRPRVAVAGFVAGGLTAIDAIERAGFDVLSHSPRVSLGRIPATTARLLIAGRGIL
jgi:squalene synthase HpnC